MLDTNLSTLTRAESIPKSLRIWMVAPAMGLSTIRAGTTVVATDDEVLSERACRISLTLHVAAGSTQRTQCSRLPDGLSSLGSCKVGFSKTRSRISKLKRQPVTQFGDYWRRCETVASRANREPKKVAVRKISTISQTLDIILFQVYNIIVTLMER